MSSDLALEASINERVNSQVYSDVISSYVDINSVTATRNIVPGSYKESVVQCTDQTLATLNSAGGQTLFTRFKLTPQVRNATMAQLAQIYFQYQIAGGTLGVALHEMTNNTTNEDISNDRCGYKAANTDGNSIPDDYVTEHLKFKLFYDSGFSLASMVQLCLVADAKVSTENFNYQQSLLTLNSLPDFVTANSTSESTLDALVHNESYRGVGSGLVECTFHGSDANGLDFTVASHVPAIKQTISIEGVIDLDRGNPLFHNFPIITRNMGELYIRLYMENFLRELKVVYLNKHRVQGPISVTSSTIDLAGMKIKPTAVWNTTSPYENTLAASSGTDGNKLTDKLTITGSVTADAEWLPYQRLPIDKADFIYLDGKLFKIRLVNLVDNTPADKVKFNEFGNPIFSLSKNINWTRFEIRKVEFDIEDYEDIKASQAKAGTYKFPVHLWRSKNFDQTNAASSSSNALQTTLNAPNIDRLFITQPWSRDYYTFLPTVACTDINPQLHNNPVLPRTEDNLNSRTCERIYNVFTDTDKYSASQDLVSSTDVPTKGKQLWLKGPDTYGGTGAFVNLQRGINPCNIPFLLPNKFAYGLELNEGGCFRRGFNSVIDGNYSPTVPINFQQSTTTSNDIYFDKVANLTEANLLKTNKDFNSAVAYGDLRESGAVASVHCLCDYIFWVNFDQFGMMTDFGVSEYNDRN